MRRFITAILALMLVLSPAWAGGKKKYMALSFDDGPNLSTTMKVLDVMKKNHVKGSFFVIGKNITPETAAAMKRAVKEGSDVECHSFSHQVMTQMTPEQIRAEVDTTCGLIEKYTGTKAQLFRAPMTDQNEVMFNNIDLTFICGYSMHDWNQSIDLDTRIKLFREHMRDGQIMLLHDLNGNDRTPQMLEVMIPEAKALGYKFVTVRKLFKKEGIKPVGGRTYSNVLE